MFSVRLKVFADCLPWRQPRNPNFLNYLLFSKLLHAFECIRRLILQVLIYQIDMMDNEIRTKCINCLNIKLIVLLLDTCITRLRS